MTVSNYREDTSIAEAIVSNFDASLLASGFDIGEAKYVGFMITANANVWRQIPSSSINYALAIVNDVCKNPVAVFKGVYTVDSPDDTVKVYAMLSGLSLPKSRIDVLITQSKELTAGIKNKETTRSLNLNLNTGANATITASQKIKDKITASKSAFSKFTNNVIDRRK